MTLKQVQASHRKLRAASVRKQEVKQELRDLITEARKAHTLNEIGQALGMTRQGVYDILRR